ncbi:glycosyltransferase family 4 protein [Chelatococcus sp. GCM10030263]|uniref:glycosyltransferase family 4 protein n=1 Tax=Chelatococcus sp. GCM10030263 TaxID=3273387 RepID=UPI00360915FB
MPPRHDAPLKLLMTADAVGGVFQYALDLASGLHAHGITTTLAVMGPAMQPAQAVAALEVPGLTILDTRLPLDWLAEDAHSVGEAAHALARIARQRGADLVQVNTPALADGPFAVPVVAAAHSCLATWWAAVKEGPLPYDFRWRTDLMARGLKAAHTVVAPSRAYAQMLADAYGIEALPVSNGRAEASAVVPPDTAAQAFTAGRLWDEGKNVATLDAAAALTAVPIRTAGPLAGPNGAQVTFRHLSWAGVLDDRGMRAELANRPIFVSAALYEPFGLTVLEAAQAGCPLVLSDIPTFRELWNGAAVFVPPRDAQGFAAALTRLAADEQERAALGATAVARATRYGITRMASAMAEIYGALINGITTTGAKEAAA